MENQKDLQDIRKEMGMFFDHALDKGSEKVFLDRVDADPTYQRAFAKEKNIRDNIKKHVKRPGVSPDLIQSIKDHIRIV